MFYFGKIVILLSVAAGLSLACEPYAEYEFGGICCPTCPPGKRVKTHCSQTRSTSCRDCVEGTFTNEPNGLDKCLPCSTCGPDSNLRAQTACTKTSNSVCEPLEGAYCLDIRDGGCTRAQIHSRCKSGEFISDRGTKNSDTTCSRCQSGTFSDGTVTSCLPHTDCQSKNLTVLKAGSPGADAVCGDQHPEQKSLYIGLGVALPLTALAIGAAFLFWKKKPFFRNAAENSGVL